MRFSASRLKLEQECPAKARFKYDEKLPTKQNARASWGSCLHKALEHYNKFTDYPGARDLFLDYWTNPDKIGVEPEYWPKMTSWGPLKKKGLEILERFHEDHRHQKRTVIAVEQEFVVPFGRHELHGFIDLVEMEKSGTGKTLIKIVDYKSNAKEPNRAELALDIQFTVYAWALTCKEFWLGNDDVGGVENGEWYWQTVLPVTPMRAIWYQLQSAHQIDAGPRTDLDFRRLYRLLDQVQQSIDAGLAIPRIGSACTFCLAPETEIITDAGIKPIGDLAGQVTNVLTSNGKFVPAPITDYGEDEVYKVTFRRGRSTKTVEATGYHRWPIRKFAHGAQEMVPTADLQPGDFAVRATLPSRSRVRPSAVGVQAGIVFGDGFMERSGGSAVTLYGDKVTDLLKWFPLSPTRTETEHATWIVDPPGTYNQPPAIRVVDLPGSFKQPPALTESKSYLLGWLAGYLATDGCVTKSGQVTIASARRENLLIARDVATLVGIRTHTIRSYQRVGKGTKPTPLYLLGFDRDDLTDELFLRPHHLDRVQEHRGSGVRPQWRVETVQRTGRRTHVYCATVAETHVFALEGGLMTGNCDFTENCWTEIPVSIAASEDPNDPTRWM